MSELLPPAIVAKQTQDAVWSIPAMTIRGRPRFPWRAFMLDESRYFKGSAEVKKLFDQMAALEMNTFHWHLTNDQGWRIEIKKPMNSHGSINREPTPSKSMSFH